MAGPVDACGAASRGEHTEGQEGCTGDLNGLLVRTQDRDLDSQHDPRLASHEHRCVGFPRSLPSTVHADTERVAHTSALPALCYGTRQAYWRK